MPRKHVQTPAFKSEVRQDQIVCHLKQESSVTAEEIIDWDPLPVSFHAKNTVNPIRKIVDALSVPPNPEKSLIKLHLGDPTLTGKLPPCEVVTKALIDAVSSHKYDGYGPSVGVIEAREAVVDRYSTKAAPFTADDVILASGASHALQLAIEAVADAGDNILIPAPGFPLYMTLCRPHGIEDRAYRLDMKRGAMVDLKHMESLIDERTKAIIVNNPGNPTGAVFPREHLEEILKIANRHHLTIIADEIYGDLTYDGAEFIPIAELSPKVPVITCDGIAKRWLVPGWRLGWVIVHDRFNVLGDVKQGMIALSQKIVGPCALVQGALPSILRDTPQSFFDNVKDVLSANASVVYNSLRMVPGLHPVRPSGAMYMMVGIDRSVYGDETSFVQGLIREQSVFCLPGSAFSAPNWFRVVLTYPEEVTLEACHRITEYCGDHLNAAPLMSDVLLNGDVSPVLEDEGCPVADEIDFDSGDSTESGESSVESRAISPV
ncbi:hypothetical protein PENTCL1PPCAC_28032 [Pristionchus entomophagus]|uniref:Tyrosine aminotransferase n=1 Tax=Pristionchus entomophagus TaxID=358040 RepID=A0AAV5UHQ4_9BILA|nr:hypothetical protein PENTCL1PPCAC_28032 [Pristionchus entomophagus]